MRSLRARNRIAVVAAAVAAAVPAAALAAGVPSLPGWMERMIGQAPPAMQQMMDSAEMQQEMSLPEVQQRMEQMMRSPEMQQMMSGDGSASAGMHGMMGADSPPAQRMGGR